MLNFWISSKKKKKIQFFKSNHQVMEKELISVMRERGLQKKKQKKR